MESVGGWDAVVSLFQFLLTQIYMSEIFLYDTFDFKFDFRIKKYLNERILFLSESHSKTLF